MSKDLVDFVGIGLVVGVELRSWALDHALEGFAGDVPGGDQVPVINGNGGTH